MDKIKLKFSKKSNVEVSYFGETISVNPIIKISEQSLLRETYLESLFKDGKEGIWDEQFAEFMFRREILRSKTNIDIDSIVEVDDVDSLIWGEFYEKVSSAIINYKEVESLIHFTLANILKKMAIENSSGFLISGLISKFKPFLDEMMNMKPEDLDKLRASASELIDKAKQEPISSILSDMNGNKTSPKKKSKKDKEYVQ